VEPNGPPIGDPRYDRAAMTLSLVATCPPGLEDLLKAELAAIRAQGIETRRSAVTFSGSWQDVYRANWRLRTANRVLVELGSWGGETGEDLAAGASALVEAEGSWAGLTAGELFAPGPTFSIRATSSSSKQRDVRWIGQKIKDGLVDAQRKRYGRRSSVNRRAPDLQFRVWLHRDRVSFFLDTSGDSLDHRDYRLDRGEAPLREHLAAACVLAAGWDGVGPVIDPMCGAGTLLAEAGAWGLGMAPGRLRVDGNGWAFERLPGFDAGLWRGVQCEPIPAPAPGIHLFGMDQDPAALRMARANLERAGLFEVATLLRGDAFETDPPPGPGLLLVNPPYGERIEEEPAQWRRLGDLLKQRYAGWRAVVVAGDKDKGKHIGLRPRKRLPIKNGPLDARILVFDLY